MFNLVYETNIASVRIWDALGFKRIGRVPGCGNLKSYPDQLVDAIIYGRDLNGEAEDYLSEERFDKIRYYLKSGLYPNGSDRAEKSRLRSAGAHYRLVPSEDGSEDMLMLKDKEVISDPQKQYEIAHRSHAATHAGINKTTASIAEKYHWIRIKETVSQAIRNCTECKESAKPSKSEPRAPKSTSLERKTSSASKKNDTQTGSPVPQFLSSSQQPSQQAQSRDSPSPAPPPQHHSPQQEMNTHIHPDPQQHHPMPIADLDHYENQHNYTHDMPVDPQIMEDMQAYAAGEQMHQFDDVDDGGVQQHHHLHQYAAHADGMDVGVVQGYYDVDVDPTEQADSQQLHEQLNSVAGLQRAWSQEKDELR